MTHSKLSIAWGGFCEGLVCSSDGKTLYFADSHNDRIKAIDLQNSSPAAGLTVLVSSASDDGSNLRFEMPHAICFDKNTKHAGTDRFESILYITASAAIRRYDIRSKQLSLLPLHDSTAHLVQLEDDPSETVSRGAGAIDCTISGVLLVVVGKRLLIAIDPETGIIEPVAGRVSLDSEADAIGLGSESFEDDVLRMVYGVSLVPVAASGEWCAFFVQLRPGCVRGLKLPQHLFL